MQRPLPIPQHHLPPNPPTRIPDILRFSCEAYALFAVVVDEAVLTDAGVDLVGLGGAFDVAEDDREFVALQVADVEFATPGDGTDPALSLSEAGEQIEPC